MSWEEYENSDDGIPWYLKADPSIFWSEYNDQEIVEPDSEKKEKLLREVKNLSTALIKTINQPKSKKDVFSELAQNYELQQILLATKEKIERLLPLIEKEIEKEEKIKETVENFTKGF